MLTFQSILNVILEKDVSYTILSDKQFHQLVTTQNVYLLKISEDSSGDDFGIKVQDILRRKQGKTEYTFLAHFCCCDHVM